MKGGPAIENREAATDQAANEMDAMTIRERVKTYIPRDGLCADLVGLLLKVRSGEE